MAKPRRAFSPKIFLTTVGPGRKMMCFSRGQTLSAQGDAADALFVIQNGRVKLRVKSRAGREAILAILSDADLVGNDCLAGQSRRIASAIALTECNCTPNYEASHKARFDTASEVGKYVLGVCVGKEHRI
jgi:CRP/FNR family cyclic AMP-dependent transcriptional regulator